MVQLGPINVKPLQAMSFLMTGKLSNRSIYFKDLELSVGTRPLASLDFGEHRTPRLKANSVRRKKITR